MIPSQYIELSDLPLNVVNSVQHYLDTGIYPSNNLEIDLLMMVSGGQGFIFGARNANSQTSAGQLALYAGGSTANYFCYYNARITISNAFRFLDSAHFYIKNNNAIWQTLNYIATAQGATNTFTGNRTMYVGGINNAGAVLGGNPVLLGGLIIKDNGVKVLDLIPCYDTVNAKIGAYDLVNESFIPVTPDADIDSSYYLLNADQSVGGQAFFKNHHDDLVKQIYGLSTNSSLSGMKKKVKCVALPDEGFKFLNWTDSNNNVLSNLQEFYYEPTASATIKANFQKTATIEDINGIFTAKVMSYGYAAAGYVDEVAYLIVRSASITNDGLQKSTSTIVCDSIPSSVLPTQSVILYSPKGKVVYIGIIQSIENNTLTCREILSAYDRDYLVNNNVFSSSIFTVTKGIDELIEKAMLNTALFSTDGDSLLMRRMFQFQPARNTGVKIDRSLSLFHENNQGAQIPNFTETELINLEDYFQNLFNDYGVYMDVILDGLDIVPYPIFYKQNMGITLSDNYERISGVNVVSESQEANVLVIYSSSGTLRGHYAVTTDGEVEAYVTDDRKFIAYNEYKSKVVTSDDNIEMIIAQNLTNSNLNHKITFDVQLGGLVSFEMLKVGTPIDFYVGNKLYKSVITAVSYEITRETVISASVTLGRVRMNLTSKLNLGKA